MWGCDLAPHLLEAAREYRMEELPRAFQTEPGEENDDPDGGGGPDSCAIQALTSPVPAVGKRTLAVSRRCLARLQAFAPCPSLSA